MTWVLMERLLNMPSVYDPGASEETRRVQDCMTKRWWKDCSAEVPVKRMLQLHFFNHTYQSLKRHIAAIMSFNSITQKNALRHSSLPSYENSERYVAAILS